MSVYTANSLKEKLLKGIDSEGNIVDMGVVLDVLEILENFELSKDDLEETRIGRYVNSMRKRTTNNAIAKQSKSLIKKWQAVVEQAVTATSVVSGSQSNPGVPSSHVSNHRRKLEDNESAANSTCDSTSPVSSTIGNGQSAAAKVVAPAVATVTTTTIQPSKGGLSLRIKLGKPMGLAAESNESSLSPALPSIKNGPMPSIAITAPSQTEKPQRRIKSTAEIAKELEQKTQLNLSNEIKEKLEKQRVEMPLQTINEPIPAPALTGAPVFGQDRKQHRGKKRGPNTTLEYDNSPSPRFMVSSMQVSSKVGLEGNEDSRSAPSKLLSAEKSEMVKRFLDTSVTPATPSSDMPLTPASAQQSVTPEPDSSAPPNETKFVFPGDYSRLSTDELYRFLSASFPLTSAEHEGEEIIEGDQGNVKKELEIGNIRHIDSRVPGVTGIVADAAQSSSADTSGLSALMETEASVSAAESAWTRWEDCVTLVSADEEKRPVFILPFVDIPEEHDSSFMNPDTTVTTNTTTTPAPEVVTIEQQSGEVS